MFSPKICSVIKSLSSHIFTYLYIYSVFSFSYMYNPLFVFDIKQFTQFIEVLMCLFLKGGQVYPIPPSLYSQRPCFVVSPLFLWWLVVVGGCMRGIEVSGGVGWLWGPWRAYLKRSIPAPSSHWGRCTLIRCAGTRDPHMQQWVERTKVIAIPLLTYTQVLGQDFFHLVARRLSNLLRVAVASIITSHICILLYLYFT